MQQPDGYDDGTGRVWKLKKAIYGLKQAGRQWNVKLDETLKVIGLKNCITDPCIYFSEEFDLILAIYVDEILILYEDAGKLNELRASLKNHFKMKDLGLAKSCIGIRISLGKDEIKLDQTAYINEILKRFGMNDCAPVKNPCTSDNLSKCEGENIHNVPYREAIGSLLFLAQATRPDISYAVSAASRYNENHNEGHWKGVKRIFRYLQLTKHFCLNFSLQEGGEALHGLTDSDYGGDVGDRKSTSGYIFMYSGAAVRALISALLLSHQQRRST